MSTYNCINLDEVLEKTGMKISTLITAINNNDFPTDINLEEKEGFWWLEVEVNEWLEKNQRQAVMDLISKRAHAQRKKYPQLSATATATEQPYIDIDKSTADFLVIQTEYRALGINLKDLLQLIQTHTSIDKTRFVNRVLFGQLRNTASKTA